MRWILENPAEAVRLAGAGRLCLATSDSWLINRLVEGGPAVTDASRESRTMLFDIARQEWISELLSVWAVEQSQLPALVRGDSIAGDLRSEFAGAEVPFGGICEDQPIRLLGHGLTKPGDVKTTYGTGAFVLTYAGADRSRRISGLMTSLGWDRDDGPVVVHDGGVYAAGTLIDLLIASRIASGYREIEDCARVRLRPDDPYFVPALAGLGAPHWRPDAQAFWSGITASHGRRELCAAAVQSIAFHVKEIVECADAGSNGAHIVAEGGLTVNTGFVHLQTDALALPVRVSTSPHITALCIARLAERALSVTSSHTPPETILYEPNRERSSALRERYGRWRSLLA